MRLKQNLTYKPKQKKINNMKTEEKINEKKYPFTEEEVKNMIEREKISGEKIFFREEELEKIDGIIDSSNSHFKTKFFKMDRSEVWKVLNLLKYCSENGFSQMDTYMYIYQEANSDGWGEHSSCYTGGRYIQ